MVTKTIKNICLWPKLESLGGPTSFQRRLMAGLQARGVEVHHNPEDPECQVILLIGGTRHLGVLWRARRRGVRILQRLDGMNWLHRRRFMGVRYALRAEYANLNLAFIRRFLADGVIYQSRFARAWWQRIYGGGERWQCVIYNGVDLNQFAPYGMHERPADRWRVLVVEGHLRGGSALGLENAIRFARALQEQETRSVELWVAGDVPEAERGQVVSLAQDLSLTWTGVVSSQRIAYLDRSAHLLFSAELHPACPNAVIEALACGLPVVGFDTGALAEIVIPSAGRVVPYGADPWRLHPPQVEPLVTASREILAHWETFSRGARQRAEAAFGLEMMTAHYLEAFQTLLG
jgi:glycosyltransferase involved in cell wall biosynthesis